MRTKHLGAFAALLLLGSGLTACGDSGESSEDTKATTAPSSEDCATLKYAEAPEGGEFVDGAQLSSAGDNTSFDPGMVQTLDEAQITNSLFDGLMEFDYTNTCKPEMKPLVAEGFEVNDDATEYTFTIKKGVKFSNGEDVLPSNFKAGWERAGSQELASPYGYVMTFIKDGDKLQDGSLKTLDSIVADDEAMTLKVTMASPNADFPAITTLSEFSPISKEDLDRLKNTSGWGKKGAYIGNGPFKLESAESPDSGEVVIVRNDTWAGDIHGNKDVALDKITFKLSTDVAGAYTAFESGETQSSTIPAGRFGDARDTYPNTLNNAQLGTYFFDFGFADAGVGGDDNVKLRQAISQSINRDEINEKVYENSRVVSTGITPLGIPGAEAGLCDFCTYDPDAAKAAFTEWEDAGGKLDAPLKLSFNTGGGHEDTVALIQAQVKETIGVDIELNPIDDDYFRVVAEEGGCQICRSGWYADYPTYGNFMVDLFGKVSIGGNNLGRYDDPDFEALIADAQGETDTDKRGELYRSAEEHLLNETVSAIPVNWYVGDQVYEEGVVNYIQPPNGLIQWEKVGVAAG